MSLCILLSLFLIVDHAKQVDKALLLQEHWIDFNTLGLEIGSIYNLER